MILIATLWQLHNHLVEEALSLERPVVMKLQSVTNVLLPQVSAVFIVVHRGMVGAASCAVRFGISTSMFIAAIFIGALAGLKSHTEGLFLRASPNL